MYNGHMIKGHNMETKTTVSLITWGGADDDQTLLDVLAEIQVLAPSTNFRLIEAYPNHSGGWPIFEITYGLEDATALEEFLGIEGE